METERNLLTTMLNAMSQDERRAMFRNQPCMIDALRLLGKTADRITRLIKKHFAPNGRVAADTCRILRPCHFRQRETAPFRDID